MPYLRLYSRDVPLVEKRLLAQKLIAITLQAFHLRPEERDTITIQFLPRTAHAGQNAPGKRSTVLEVMLEVSDHDLTVEKVTAFVRQATPLLQTSAAASNRGPISRLLGRADESRQVTFQFSEMNSKRETASDYPDFAPRRNRVA